MATYCRTCGKLMEEGGDICEACKENIRAEAMGKRRKISQDVPKEAARLRVRGRKKVNGEDSTAGSRKGDTEKKPHHFKSMADYLEYLKKNKE